MAFEAKLRKIVDRATEQGLRRLQSRTKKIADHVSRSLRTWEPGRNRNTGHLEEEIDEARCEAELVDAALLVRDRVLNAKHGVVHTLQLKRDLRAAQDQILDLFDERKAPRRGFVYVAWSHKPERYYYVGKATSVDRLNLGSHGKLARATAHATKLSLAFPNQSRDDYLLDVEASIIRLLEDLTGDLPEYNERPGSVPEHEGSAILEELGRFLRKCDDLLNR